MSLAVTERMTSVVCVVKIVAAGEEISQWEPTDVAAASAYLFAVSSSKSQSAESQLDANLYQTAKQTSPLRSKPC